jgi:hypothetical protein
MHLYINIYGSGQAFMTFNSRKIFVFYYLPLIVLFKKSVIIGIKIKKLEILPCMGNVPSFLRG